MCPFYFIKLYKAQMCFYLKYVLLLRWDTFTIGGEIQVRDEMCALLAFIVAVHHRHSRKSNITKEKKIIGHSSTIGRYTWGCTVTSECSSVAWAHLVLLARELNRSPGCMLTGRPCCSWQRPVASQLTVSWDISCPSALSFYRASVPWNLYFLSLMMTSKWMQGWRGLFSWLCVEIKDGG